LATGKVREKIAERPYAHWYLDFVLTRGTDCLSPSTGHLVNWLLGRTKSLARQTGSLIQPSTDIASSRGGQESERLHTDTADWETPVELISMRCVRADRGGGGRSRILDIDSVRDEVKNRLTAICWAFYQMKPVPWQLAAYRGAASVAAGVD